MRVWDNMAFRIIIKGCKECPNHAKLCHNPYHYCKALTSYEEQDTIFGGEEIPIYANISKYVQGGGFHPNCPLQEIKR